MDALPDAHFVGFAQAVNDFGISSGKFALARSANDIVRDYAARAVAEHATAVQSLSKSRADAGVSYDGKMGPVTANALTQLSALQGPEFDAAFANLQVAVQTANGNQFVAFEPERLPRGIFLEHQRNNAHTDKIGPVNAFERLCDHRAHPKEDRALGRPIA